MRHPIAEFFAMLMVAAVLVGGMSVLCQAADAPTQDPPKSPQARRAREEHDRAVAVAAKSYRDGCVAAARAYRASLKKAMDAALATKDVNEIKRIDAEIVGVDAELHALLADGQISPPRSAPKPSEDLSYRWNNGQIFTFRRDKHVFSGAKDHGTWRTEEDTMVILWDNYDGKPPSEERLKILDGGKALDGGTYGKHEQTKTP